MKILALDLATVTGWCVLDETGAARTGEWKLVGCRAERALQLMEKVQSAHAQFHPAVVAMEEPMAFRGSGVIALAGLNMAAEMACERQGVPYASVHVSTLKKFATGSGRAKKPEMVAAAERILGRTGISEHEADAFHVASWALENVSLGVGG